MTMRSRNPSNRKGTPARTAIYARISRPATMTTARELNRQVAECEDYAKAQRLDVVGLYIDNSQSAMTGKRPEYRRLLADVEAGLVDVILVWSADRLYRKLADLETLVDTLGATTVETVRSGDIDLSTADGRMIARLLGSSRRGRARSRLNASSPPRSNGPPKAANPAASAASATASTTATSSPPRLRLSARPHVG